MFYKKIDLRKLYENIDSEVTAGAEMPEDAVDVSQEEEAAQAGEAEDLKKQRNAGRMYAWPISQEDEDELRSLTSAGTGVWTSKEPLKLWVNGKDGEPAMIGEKPVYLRIKIVANKADRHNPVESAADREYVEYVTSAEELVNVLDTAVNVTNSVRVSVTTPFLKSGKSTEHSLEMWLDHESRLSDSELDAAGSIAVDSTVDSLDSSDSELDAVGNVAVSNTIDDLDAQMENPGTAAGIGESNRYFYNEIEIDRMIGSILENTKYQLIRKTSAGDARWLLDVTNDKAYSVTSADMYKQLYTKLKISGKSTPIEDVKVDAAVKNGGNKDASSFLTDVTPTGSVDTSKKEETKKSNTVVVDGKIADIIKTKRALKRGRKGEAVKELQQFLKIDDDGIFGKGTEAAVKKWQKENGLVDDGIIGSKSAAKIVELLSKPKEEPNKEEETKKEETNKEETNKEEETKEESKEEEKEEEKDLDEMSLEELEAELDKTNADLKSAKKKRRRNRKADRKKKRLINKINRKKKRKNKKSGDSSILEESVVYSFDDFIKKSNGLQDNLNDFFNGKK